MENIKEESENGWMDLQDLKNERLVVGFIGFGFWIEDWLGFDKS
jgi:hypothetical protein